VKCIEHVLTLQQQNAAMISRAESLVMIFAGEEHPTSALSSDESESRQAKSNDEELDDGAEKLQNFVNHVPVTLIR
jgi:hypothetical protein